MKQKARISRSDKELHSIGEHLRYEVDMLRGTAYNLAQRVPDQFTVNVCIESFTTHARALIHFLYPDGKIDDDDVLAEDFFASREEWEKVRGAKLPKPLEQVRARVGKEIVHLTYHRLSVTSEAKKWDYLSIAASFDAMLKLFAEAAPKLDRDTRDRLSRALVQTRPASRDP